jgi:hypothetical protein
MIERVLNKHAHDPRVMRALEEKHQDGNSNSNVRNIFDEGNIVVTPESGLCKPLLSS